VRFTWSKHVPTALVAGLLIAAFVSPRVYAQGDVTAETGFQKLKPAEDYGTVVIERNTKNIKTVNPVVFPHWAHRKGYTCKVCHTDLGFTMKAGATDIKQADIEAGRSCGACHNGKEAFGPFECIRCHSWGIEVKENLKIGEFLNGLPKDDFGNRVNWVNALREGNIKPKADLAGKEEMTVLDLDIEIPVSKFTPHPPGVVFPHKAHTEQLFCSSCHPGIFTQQRGANPEMNMMRIIAGKYCGECHGHVAFPLEDCFRCHSKPAPVPEWLKKGGEKDGDKESEKK